MTVTGWYYVIGVLIAGPFFGRDVFGFDYGSLPPLAVAEIVYVLVLGTTLPNYLLDYGTEKLTSVHTGLYAYLQPIAATALGLYRHQIELGYDDLVAAILIFVGIVLVIITYVKFGFFPLPAREKRPAETVRNRCPYPEFPSRRRQTEKGDGAMLRRVVRNLPSRCRIDKGGGGIWGKRRDVCVVSDNRSIFRTENRQRLPEPCMRGAGGCPRPSAESLGGGRAERRRAVRFRSGEVRKRIEYAMMLREKGISIREENPEDRRTIGRVVERAFRAEERSDHREYLLVERLRGSEAFVGRF